MYVLYICINGHSVILIYREGGIKNGDGFAALSLKMTSLILVKQPKHCSDSAWHVSSAEMVYLSG